MRSRNSLGIDIGGTFTKTIMLSDNRTLFDETINTPQMNSHDALTNFVVNIYQKYRAVTDGVDGVGIGIAGVVNSKLGIIEASCSFPSITGVPFINILNEQLSIPIVFDNDSNFACLGEYNYTLCRNTSVAVVLTLGTGIGSGIIIDGKLFTGAFGYSGEFGHFCLEPAGEQCGCGSCGCLNILSSAKAIVKKYNELSVNSKVNTSEEVLRNWHNGDPVSEIVLDNACHYLGKMISYIILSVNPEYILLSGGLSRAGDVLLKKIKSYAHMYTIPVVWRRTSIMIGTLYEKSGAYGAALEVRKVLA